MLRINERVKFKIACPKHSRYNPEVMGQGAIKAGCGYCTELFWMYSLFRNTLRSLKILEDRFNDAIQKNRQAGLERLSACAAPVARRLAAVGTRDEI